MGLRSKLVIAVLPELHRVASLMVYALQQTTFYQSGVYSQGLQFPEPQITDRLGILPNLIHLKPRGFDKRIPVSERTVFVSCL